MVNDRNFSFRSKTFFLIICYYHVRFLCVCGREGGSLCETYHLIREWPIKEFLLNKVVTVLFYYYLVRETGLELARVGDAAA